MNHSLRKNKGFVSVYFLAILLYISEVSAVIIACDMYRMKTVMNLKENQRYAVQESKIITSMKIQLSDPELDLEDLYIYEYPCEIVVESGMIRIFVNTDDAEYIDLFTDSGYEHVLSYETYRFNNHEEE